MPVFKASFDVIFTLVAAADEKDIFVYVVNLVKAFYNDILL